MGNEIAYLKPTKYKVFLGLAGRYPPLQPMDPYENLAHRLSFPQFKIAKGGIAQGIGGSMESLVEFRTEFVNLYYFNWRFHRGTRGPGGGAPGSSWVLVF